ncbi:COX15/CtaA family protein [Terrarubrum flagellatum]|uniref:COX15/CtaA family protein n=1 Tax=Terrirubrum flagellatum TaxID=2895980 RepID=UPI0031450D9E
MSLASELHPADLAVAKARDPLAPVRAWLWLTLGLVLLMITIGGATRLTGSGLSITEWKPISGALPPLSNADWLAEFERYRQIPQYELLNKGMTLGEFQFIYWWEWSHRQLGRLIGLVYLAGFLWFAIRRTLSLRATALLFAVGLLLGLQGAIGWIMVASGLQPGMIAVAPVKLTLHLVFASLFLMSLAAMAVAMTPPRATEKPATSGLRAGAWIVLALTLFQIALGGLVAGSRAGLNYNTWPLMDGQWVLPAEQLFAKTPFIENFVDNIPLVQFNHRLGAYLLVIVAILHAVFASRALPGSSFTKRARALAALFTGQAALGIATLLLAVPLWAGLAHQAYAMVVLTMATIHLARATGARVGARAGA